MPRTRVAPPGVVTMKDVVQVLCEGDSRVVDRLRVADVLSEPAICVQRDAALLDRIRLTRNARVRSSPVFHATTPVGLLSFTDVVRALAAQPLSSPDLRPRRRRTG